MKTNSREHRAPIVDSRGWKYSNGMSREQGNWAWEKKRVGPPNNDKLDLPKGEAILITEKAEKNLDS